MTQPIVIGNATLYLGDCIETMRRLPAGSVLDSGKMIEVLAAPGEEPPRPLPQYPNHFTLRGK